MTMFASLRDSDIGQQFLRFAPAGAGAAITKWTLNDTVALLTVGYIIIQAAYLLRKWWREEKQASRAPRRKG